MVTKSLNLGKTQIYPGWLNIHLPEGRLWSTLPPEFLPDSSHSAEISQVPPVC